MSRHRGKIATVTILSILFVAVLFMYEIEIVKVDSEDLDMSNANCAVNVEYYGLFEGEQVTIPIIENAPFLIGGVEVDTIGIEITWTVTGENMNWDTLVIAGSVKIYSLDYTGQIKTDITANIGYSTTFVKTGSQSLTETLTYNIVLDTLLSGVALSGPDYWTLKAETKVTGQCDDNDNVQFTDSTGLMYATYTIYEGVSPSSFSIDGNIT